MTTSEVVVDCETSLLRIQDVTGLNLGSEEGYSD